MIFHQVCNLLEEYKNQNMAWYLNTLNLFEKSKDSSEELLQKIDRAVSNFNRKTSSRLATFYYFLFVFLTMFLLFFLVKYET